MRVFFYLSAALVLSGILLLGLRETSGTPGRRSTIDQVALLGARFSHPVVPAHTDAGRSTVSLRTANAGLHVA